MKKKVIATSLLTILVSTYAAPLVSNAEAIKGATKETTEQVAPTTESEAPTTESEAPTTESGAPTTESGAPTTESEAPATESKAPTTESKVPTTKEAPSSRATEEEIAEQLAFGNKYNEAKALIEKLYNDGVIDGPRRTHLIGRLESATTINDLNVLISDINTYIVQPNDQANLPGIKQDALNQIAEWLNYGKIDDNIYQNAQATILAANDAATVAQVLTNVEGLIQANVAANLTVIKDDAKDQLLGWFNEGLLTPNDYAYYLNEINNAPDAEAVAAVVASAEQQAQQNGLHTSLDTIKENAKDQLFNWLSYGQINDNQYVNGINSINNAATAEEVQAVLDGIQAEIDAEVAATLAQIKEDAKDQLLGWFNEGLLTANDYAHYLNELNNAADAEAVAAVIASAEQQIEQNGLHFDLEAYKEDARDQLSTWLAGGWITSDQYWAYLSLIDVATSAEQVDAALQQLLAEIDNADTLENAQNNATNQLIEWLSEGKITEAQYYAYLQRIADATTIAEVNAIMNELRAIIAGNGEDVTTKPIATPSNNTNNVLVSVSHKGKNIKYVNTKREELPKTGEANQNLTALGLMSVALGSLVAVFKRKRS